MTFATLALVIALGLVGPIVALPRSWRLPLVLGELGAGAAFGSTGLRVLDAADPTFAFLANVGFALVMFVAGSHVPVRDRAVRQALGRGFVRAVLVGVVAAVCGVGISAVFETGHGALYAVLMGSSSAALVLPMVQSMGLGGRRVLDLTAQVAIADTACIVALPLAIDPAHALRAIAGAFAVTAGAVALFVVLLLLERSGIRARVHEVSEERNFAVELRVGLVALFALAALASTSRVSIMVAGFAAGLAVAGVGPPRRVANQLFAVSDGFFAPLFFVWLGARIDLRELAAHPHQILLGVALAAGALLAHVSMRLMGQQVSFGVLAAAQLGVPVAAVTIGTQQHAFAPGESAALLLAAVVTIIATAVAGSTASASRRARVEGA
jgi:Kef-type K+ transport system membrane component KefB